MFVVAGVTGHVGAVVAKELLGHGEKVKVLVREEAKGAAWSKLGAEVAVGGLDNTSFLSKALEGASGFFALLPPNYHVQGFYAFQRKLADGIAAAVKETRVPQVVLLSSVGANLAEGNGPIKGLHHFENVLRGTGTRLTAIRAASFQENIANSLEAARGAGIYPNMTPSADAPMPMVATHDIGLLAAHELTLPSARGEVIDLLGPAYSVRQVAKMLGDALGKPLQVVDIPPEAQVATLVKSGMSQELAEVFAEMNAGFASGRIKPVGDRMKQGRSGIERVIRSLTERR